MLPQLLLAALAVTTPLWVQGQLTLDMYDNSAMAGEPAHSSTLDSLDFSLPLDQPFSAEVTGTINFAGVDVSPPRSGATATHFAFECSFSSNAQMVFVWVEDHLICHTDPVPFSNARNSTDGIVPNPLNMTNRLLRSPENDMPLPVVIHVYSDAKTASTSLSVSVQWIPLLQPDFVGSKHPAVVIPTKALQPDLPDLEVQRRELQDSLKTGWNVWAYNMLEPIKLPHSLGVATGICQLSTQDCLLYTFIEDGHAVVRPGIFATDLSYWQFYVGFQGLNVSLSYTGGASPLSIVAEPMNCQTADLTANPSDFTGDFTAVNCSDYALAVLPRFAWFRQGEITLNSDKGLISASPLNQASITLGLTRPSDSSALDSFLPSDVTDKPHLVLGFAQGAVGIGELPAESTALPLLADLQHVVGKARAAELARYAAYGENADIVEAVQAATMWNYIYTPAEYGPILPVSRKWNFVTGAVNSDWRYVIFDWDNLFASYMSSFALKEIAYSNLIQTVRSKTAEGFVPNFSAAGTKSQDRTEPPIGGKVVLEIYKKYKDKWILELLFDDLLAWNDWFVAQRLGGPLGLVSLGSNTIDGFTLDSAGRMQGARYESGLDNSPMYDGEFYNANVSHTGSYGVGLMELYDVGMASLFVADADALAELATILGRTDDAAMLTARADSQRDLIQHLWDAEAGIFTNLFWNNTFYPRYSPTSFYALMAKAATDDQADQMMTDWLMSPDHFCVSPTGDFAGNSDDCYWGLPSIEFADPAYPPLGYWRGYVWGPMAQLTYWSLQEYDHVPTVRQGRKALCNQMTDLMLSKWRTKRHICENYNPHHDAEDCSGTKFYHWGALTGMISLIEEGLYN